MRILHPGPRCPCPECMRLYQDVPDSAAILDTTGVPDSELARVGKAYAEAIARSWRDNLYTLKTHVLVDGWTIEQHRHWVETGEWPK